MSGFSSDVDRQLHCAANLDQCKEREKYIILLLDEMHVKEYLVFDKHSGQLISFVNLGEVNNHLLELERSLAADENLHQLLMKKCASVHTQYPGT